MITIRDLSFIRGKIILNNISLDIRSNELTILIGPNGAGKTTFLKILSGLIGDFTGKVLVNGRDIRSFPKKELATHISFQPQSEEFLLPISVRDVLLAGRYPYKKLFSDYNRSDLEIYDQCIDKFEIGDITARDINTLSSGERRRVLIASAYIQDVPILLFDEPFANLDPEGVMDLKAVFSGLKGEGKTLLVVSHNLEPLYSLTDNLIALREGNVIYSGKRKGTAAVLRKTFNMDFERIRHNKTELFVPHEKQD